MDRIGGQMKIYAIYDLNEKEQCTRIGALDEIAKFLNLTAREIGRALKNKNKIRNQYELYYLFEEEN